MKKIMFISNVDSFNNFYLYYYEKLSSLGWMVDIASKGNMQYENINRKFNVDFGRTPFKLSNIKAFLKLRKILKTNKYDIIFCNTPVPSAISRLALIGIKRDSKVIYSAHGYNFSKENNGVKEKLFISIERWLSNFTDVIITMNQEDYDLSKKHKFKSQIINVDGVGIDPKKFKQTSECKHIIRIKNSIPENAFILIYPAELTDRKNQKLGFQIVENLKDLPNIIYLSCGQGANFDEYKMIIKETNIPVKLLGFRKDISELLCMSDVLLATSKSEGLPINIIEAMSSGLPIIATNCKGHSDLVENNKNGYLFNLDNVDEAVNYIRKLYNDQKLYNTLSTESVNMSKKYYVEVVFKQYLKIFEELTRKNS